jgi:peptide/nickel transport system substrate-binding protein
MIPLVGLVLLLALLATACGGGTTTTATQAPVTQTVTTTATTTSTSTATVSQPGTITTVTATVPAASPSTPSSGPKYGGTLTVAEPIFPGQPLGYPPDRMFAEMIFQQMCLEPLLWQSVDGVFHPRLATEWKVADDGSSVTFTLRKNVTFHDGSELNAQVVKWNYDLEIEAGKALNWKSVDAIDNSTVRVNLKQWMNSALQDFSFEGGNYIISKAAFDKNGIDWVRQNMVGTGPFKQSDYVRDTLVAFTKNDKYWDTGKPYVDKLVYKCIPDALVQEAAFKAKELDGMASGITPTLVSLVKSGMVAVTGILGVGCYVPDSVHPNSPLANEKFRMALEYAMDKEAYIAAFSNGLFGPAYQWCPPTSAAYDPSLPERKYDVAKAKALLTEAGYPNGASINFYYTNDPPGSDMSQAVAEQWAEIGIKVNAQVLPSAKFEEYSRTGWENGLLFVAPQGPADWGKVIYNTFNPDPKTTSYVSAQRTQEFTDLANAAVNSFNRDPVKQRAIVKYMYDHEMVIPTWNVCRAWVTQPYLKGGDFLKQGAGFFWDAASVWLDK